MIKIAFNFRKIMITTLNIINKRRKKKMKHKNQTIEFSSVSRNNEEKGFRRVTFQKVLNLIIYVVFGLDDDL